tara:strand:+ start:108 stop:2381 length:2274 start_codon:yes stop_codon:yes gene_type:complete
MALIDLKTDLKSLKYSKDRIGGGSSNQPFVQKPIPDSFSAVGNTGGLDVLTRGGSLAFQSTADDVSRLTKLLLTPSTFQGPFFTIKQNILSRQGVQTQASPKGLNEGYYLPTNTLAQVAVNSTGLHFNKNGVNPIPGLPGSLTTYSDVVSHEPYEQDSKNNRLVKLTDSFINKESGNILRTYPGGPGSILGLGVTTINIPGNQRTGLNTAGTTLNKFFGSEGVKDPLYDLLPPPELLLGKESAPTDIPQYLIPPVPALKYKVFTNPRLVSLDYRRYISLSYNAGISGLGADEINNRTKYQNNTLISVKTAPRGTQVAGINPTADSTYAKENFPGVTLYKLGGEKGGLTNLFSLIGASVSASVKLGFPGATRNTNTLITAKTAPKGTKTDGVDLDSNSNYTIANNLTGSLYGSITGSASNAGKVITPFIRTSQPTVAAGSGSNLENTTAYTYTPDQLKTAPSYRPGGQIQDFRQKFRNKGGDALTVGADIIAPNYVSQNIENRVHLGNPGTKGDVSNYVRGKVIRGTAAGALDKINALPLYSSTEVKQDNEKPVNDLVKFRIAVLDSGGSATKTFIHFRAFLDNISDNYSADWQSHKYVGRGENFYTYSGFDRKISLSWTVYAQSKEELIPMYKKLNFLASTLAPDYNGGFMRGTLVQLTIGGYVYEQPGFITGLNYEITEATPWEIGITGEGFTAPDNLGDNSVKELPHMIKVSGFSFTPIHTFIPQVQKKGTGTLGNGPEQYIALSNGGDNNYKRD